MNSAHYSLWSDSSYDLTDTLKYIRLGELLGQITLFTIGIIMSDWSNQGYAWFMHNSIMGVTLISTILMFIASLLSDDYRGLNEITGSFFAFSFAA